MCCNYSAPPLPNRTTESLGVEIVRVYASSDQSRSTGIVHSNKMQVHVVTCDSFTIQTLRLETIQQTQWKHFPEQYVLSVDAFSLSPALCILHSPSKVDKHRFDALGAAHLAHYSKCQLCKWSTVCLSSHISWVIALWQPYLFWCSIHTSIAYHASSIISPF